MKVEKLKKCNVSNAGIAHMWFVENFCVYPQLPAKIFYLTEDYKTSCQFFILLYFVIFFSLLLQADCVASNQPLILPAFTENICHFLVLRIFPSFFLIAQFVYLFTKRISLHKLTLQLL